MRPKTFTLVISLCFIAPFGRSNYAKDHSSASPDIQHVLFLVSDDLKASVLGCYGNTQCKTPNIDQLTNSGMILTDHYTGSPVCAPSRSILLTGLHSGNNPIRGND